MTRVDGKAPPKPPADPAVTMATTIVNGIVAGFMQVMQQTRAPSGSLCAFCLRSMREWEIANVEALRTAEQAMRDASERTHMNPELLTDPRPFLDPELALTIPPVRFSVTQVGGTDCCEVHVLADQAQQPSEQRPSLLVATANVDMRKVQDVTKRHAVRRG